MSQDPARAEYARMTKAQLEEFLRQPSLSEPDRSAAVDALSERISEELLQAAAAPSAARPAAVGVASRLWSRAAAATKPTADRPASRSANAAQAHARSQPEPAAQMPRQGQKKKGAFGFGRVLLVIVGVIALLAVVFSQIRGSSSRSPSFRDFPPRTEYASECYTPDGTCDVRPRTRVGFPCQCWNSFFGWHVSGSAQ